MGKILIFSFSHNFLFNKLGAKIMNKQKKNVRHILFPLKIYGKSIDISFSPYFISINQPPKIINI
jgi:hypothetical protein